jgi:hypothetical protein
MIGGGLDFAFDATPEGGAEIEQDGLQCSGTAVGFVGIRLKRCAADIAVVDQLAVGGAQALEAFSQCEVAFLEFVRFEIKLRRDALE